MKKTDDRFAAPPYTISTPWGKCALHYVSNSTPDANTPDFLKVRLTLEDRAVVISFPADTLQTNSKTGKEISGGFRPQYMFEHGARIQSITPNPCAIGYHRDRHEWGKVIFQTGIAVSYAMLREDRHTIEEKRLVMETKANYEQVATKAAEKVLSSISSALRCSKLNPDRDANDDLVQAFVLERNNHPTAKDTFKALARMDFKKAGKDGQGVWFQHSAAVKLNADAVQGKQITAKMINNRAEALRKRYARIKIRKLPTAKM